VAPDGRRKIQMRLDLGVLQMEVEGRPDGLRPHGAESLLQHYLALEEHAEVGADEFRLEPAACGELQQEAAQYYYRYLSRYALRDLSGVIADTEHNLEVLDLVDRCSDDDDIVWQFLQFYPYIRMMNARAHAEMAAEAKRYEEAVNALDQAILDIRAFWELNGDEEDVEDSREIDALNQLMGEIRGSTPRTEMDKLQEELTRAIAAEHYEKAASLRDAIKALSHL
jgi:tetratricopeptide (TPR) repeat protein